MDARAGVRVSGGLVVDLVERAERLVGGVGEDRREQAAQQVGDVPQRGLCAAAALGVGRVAIQAVLDGREIDGAERVVAEVVEREGGGAEVARVVGGADLLREVVGLRERPRVDRVRRERGPRDAIALAVGMALSGLAGREVVEVGEQEADRVAHLAVRLARGVEVGRIDLDVVLERERRDPPAADIGAERLEEFLDIQRVAERLGHLLAVLVDHEPVGEDGVVGRATGRAQADEQRGLEPAAVLVGALEVEVDGEGGFAETVAQGGVPRRAGLEPDIEDVARLLERVEVDVLRRIGVGAQVVVREEFARRHLEPRVAALLAEQLRDGAHGRGGEERGGLAAGVLLEERGDGETPRALARDAPVGA